MASQYKAFSLAGISLRLQGLRRTFSSSASMLSTSLVSPSRVRTRSTRSPPMEISEKSATINASAFGSMVMYVSPLLDE